MKCATNQDNWYLVQLERFQFSNSLTVIYNFRCDCVYYRNYWYRSKSRKFVSIKCELSHRSNYLKFHLKHECFVTRYVFVWKIPGSNTRIVVVEFLLIRFRMYRIKKSNFVLMVNVFSCSIDLYRLLVTRMVWLFYCTCWHQPFA